MGIQITVGSLPDGFYIADNGVGISSEDRTQIFEKRDSNSPTGTGIGLSIVQQIADAHGWSIASTEGSTGGARFEITAVDFYRSDDCDER